RRRDRGRGRPLRSWRSDDLEWGRGESTDRAPARDAPLCGRSRLETTEDVRATTRPVAALVEQAPRAWRTRHRRSAWWARAGRAPAATSSPAVAALVERAPRA